MSFFPLPKGGRYCVTDPDQRFVVLNTAQTKPAIAHAAKTSLLSLILHMLNLSYPL